MHPCEDGAQFSLDRGIECGCDGTITFFGRLDVTRSGPHRRLPVNEARLTWSEGSSNEVTRDGKSVKGFLKLYAM